MDSLLPLSNPASMISIDSPPASNLMSHDSIHMSHDSTHLGELDLLSADAVEVTELITNCFKDMDCSKVDAASLELEHLSINDEDYTQLVEAKGMKDEGLHTYNGVASTVSVGREEPISTELSDSLDLQLEYPRRNITKTKDASRDMNGGDDIHDIHHSRNCESVIKKANLLEDSDKNKYGDNNAQQPSTDDVLNDISEIISLPDCENGVDCKTQSPSNTAPLDLQTDSYSPAKNGGLASPSSSPTANEKPSKNLGCQSKKFGGGETPIIVGDEMIHWTSETISPTKKGVDLKDANEHDSSDGRIEELSAMKCVYEKEEEGWDPIRGGAMQSLEEPEDVDEQDLDEVASVGSSSSGSATQGVLRERGGPRRKAPVAPKAPPRRILPKPPPSSTSMDTPVPLLQACHSNSNSPIHRSMGGGGTPDSSLSIPSVVQDAITESSSFFPNNSDIDVDGPGSYLMIRSPQQHQQQQQFILQQLPDGQNFQVGQNTSSFQNHAGGIPMSQPQQGSNCVGIMSYQPNGNLILQGNGVIGTQTASAPTYNQVSSQNGHVNGQNRHVIGQNGHLNGQNGHLNGQNGHLSGSVTDLVGASVGDLVIADRRQLEQLGVPYKHISPTHTINNNNTLGQGEIVIPPGTLNVAPVNSCGPAVSQGPSSQLTNHQQSPRPIHQQSPRHVVRTPKSAFSQQSRQSQYQPPPHQVRFPDPIYHNGQHAIIQGSNAQIGNQTNSEVVQTGQGPMYNNFTTTPQAMNSQARAQQNPGIQGSNPSVSARIVTSSQSQPLTQLLGFRPPNENLTSSRAPIYQNINMSNGALTLNSASNNISVSQSDVTTQNQGSGARKPVYGFSGGQIDLADDASIQKQLKATMGSKHKVKRLGGQPGDVKNAKSGVKNGLSNGQPSLQSGQVNCPQGMNTNPLGSDDLNQELEARKKRFQKEMSQCSRASEIGRGREMFLEGNVGGLLAGGFQYNLIPKADAQNSSQRMESGGSGELHLSTDLKIDVKTYLNCNGGEKSGEKMNSGSFERYLPSQQQVVENSETRLPTEVGRVNIEAWRLAAFDDQFNQRSGYESIVVPNNTRNHQQNFQFRFPWQDDGDNDSPMENSSLDNIPDIGNPSRSNVTTHASNNFPMSHSVRDRPLPEPPVVQSGLPSDLENLPLMELLPASHYSNIQEINEEQNTQQMSRQLNTNHAVPNARNNMAPVIDDLLIPDPVVMQAGSFQDGLHFSRGSDVSMRSDGSLNMNNLSHKTGSRHPHRSVQGNPNIIDPHPGQDKTQVYRDKNCLPNSSSKNKGKESHSSSHRKSKRAEKKKTGLSSADVGLWARTGALELAFDQPQDLQLPPTQPMDYHHQNRYRRPEPPRDLNHTHQQNLTLHTNPNRLQQQQSTSSSKSKPPSHQSASNHLSMATATTQQFNIPCQGITPNLPIPTPREQINTTNTFNINVPLSSHAVQATRLQPSIPSSINQHNLNITHQLMPRSSQGQQTKSTASPSSSSSAGRKSSSRKHGHVTSNPPIYSNTQHLTSNGRVPIPAQTPPTNNLSSPCTQVSASSQRIPSQTTLAGASANGELSAPISLIDNSDDFSLRSKEPISLEDSDLCSIGSGGSSLESKRRWLDSLGVDEEQDTPLHCLCDMPPSFMEAVQANRNFNREVIDHQNNRQETALFVAVVKKNLHVVKFLVKNGANVNIICRSDCKTYRRRASAEYQTALHEAVESGNAEITKILLTLSQRSPKPEIDSRRKGSGLTPLMLALSCHSLPDANNLDIIMLLLRQGASMYTQDAEGKTPLMYMVMSGDVQLVTSMLDKDVQVARSLVTAVTRKKQMTCLHYAAALNRVDRRRKIELLGVLIKHGALPDAMNTDRQTPRHWASNEISEVMSQLRTMTDGDAQPSEVPVQLVE